MAHDDTEQRVGNLEEEELSAFQLHEEFDEPRDRSNVVNHLAMWIYGQWKRSLPKSRMQHDLRMICTMPLDILYEIFEHLHPIDLYHVSRTSRSFHDILRRAGSSSVWRTAYESQSEIPKCPPDTSELEWADLLFGKHICQKCGSGGAPPNLTFRHRLCRKCANLCLLGKYALFFPSSSVWTLVRRSQVIHMFPNGSFEENWPVYMKDEANRIDRQLSVVNIATIRQIVEEYNTTRNLDITSIHSHVLKSWHWAQHIALGYQNQREVRYERNMRRIRARLVRSGHTLVDVQKAEYDEEVLDEIKELKSSSLPTRYWDLLRPRLEPAIDVARVSRLQKARKLLIRARTAFIKDRYNQYKKEETHPSTWSYHPPLYSVCEFDMIRKLIDREGDEVLRIDDRGVKDAMARLPEAVEMWTREKMRQLAGLLPGSRGNDSNFCDEDDFAVGCSDDLDLPPPEKGPDLHLLNLATSVFTCMGSTISSVRAGRCLIGWDGAGPHLRCGALQTHWDKRLHFSQRGYDAAKSLVVLVGWDPEKTTAMQMDGFDGRFLCGCCNDAGPGEGRKAFTWRECVLHYMERESELETAYSPPAWSLLTDEAKADVVRREEFDPYIKDKSWSCMHCSVHYLAPVVKRGAIDHCKAVHDIRRPIETLDYLHVITTERTPRRPALYYEIANCLCLHCPDTGVKRLRTLVAVRPHLRDAHQVGKPVVHRDWVQVETILRSTTSVHAEEAFDMPIIYY